MGGEALPILCSEQLPNDLPCPRAADATWGGRPMCARHLADRARRVGGVQRALSEMVKAAGGRDGGGNAGA